MQTVFILGSFTSMDTFEVVWSFITVNVLDQCLQGYNATLLAYGQTGSGKSYSMVGYGPNKGLVPKLCERLFEAIGENKDTRQCQVECVFVCLCSPAHCRLWWLFC